MGFHSFEERLKARVGTETFELRFYSDPNHLWVSRFHPFRQPEERPVLVSQGSVNQCYAEWGKVTPAPGSFQLKGKGFGLSPFS
jgi:hypothetical protein